jgi:tetratricopeptide (TPR) repeat protein
LTRPLIVALLWLLPTAAVPAQRPAQPDAARAGWDALNAGRLQEAAAIFGDAVRRSPTPAVLLGAALAAHLQQRHEEARQHLVAALKIDPALTAASLLLGDVLHRQGDIDGAILIYEEALTHAPEQARIQKTLEAWRKESALHSTFGQRLSDHFTVLFEGPAEAARRRARVTGVRSQFSKSTLRLED